MSKRIGVFGGSFDPVHIGHLWIAEAAREHLSLDEVRWIPAATSPLKTNGPIASDEDRLQMVRLAISGNSHFVLDERELRRGEMSYTVDTMTELVAEHPGDNFFLIIGSDSLETFDRWREPKRLLELVTLAVIQRGGDPVVDVSVVDQYVDANEPNQNAVSVVPMPLIQASSTDVRNRLANGKSIRYQVPAAVEAYLHTNKIYQR
ncbi:nicotinate-nucleotide adenylyltransferase [Rubripirellula amarantea]|nr:nicotinate-nucleotide adenylyltransferase [Rubripirellula amarantea]